MAIGTTLIIRKQKQYLINVWRIKLLDTTKAIIDHITEVINTQSFKDNFHVWMHIRITTIHTNFAAKFIVIR